MSLKINLGKLGKYLIKLALALVVLTGVVIWIWTPSNVLQEGAESPVYQEKPILLSEPKLYEFSNSEIRIQLSARRAEIFERSQKTRLVEIRARLFQESGATEFEPISIRANFGQINHDRDFVRLWGDVILDLEDGQKIMTEELFIQSKNDVIYNEVPVRFTKEQDVVAAVSFTYNYRDNTLELIRPQIKLRI